MNYPKLIRFGAAMCVPILVSWLTSCGGSSKAQGPMNLPPPPVSVVAVHAEDVPIYAEYAAQTFARDAVDVRGRVDGFIEKRLFQIGSDVRQGQVLYTLDLRPYAADVAKARGDVAQARANLEYAQKQVGLIQAEANLAQAKANLVKAQQDVDRLQPLVKDEAASKQDLDNAVSALAGSKANVAALQAAVDQARLQARTNIDAAAAQVEANKALLNSSELNLNYATITAPISGRIGDSLIQVGGLVSKNSTSALTTIVPLDPIWVRFKISEAEYLGTDRLTKAKGGKIPLKLVLADGKVFDHAGEIRNTLNQVDLKTGTLEMQATFSNPQHILLPGQYGRIRLERQIAKNTIVVPQRAVQELQDLQSVFVVGPENKAAVRPVVMGDRVGDNWIVTKGLQAGDKVIVEGVQKVRPGSTVQPSPYKPTPDNTASTAGTQE